MEEPVPAEVETREETSRWQRAGTVIALIAVIAGTAVYIQQRVVPVLRGEESARSGVGDKPNGFDISNASIPKRKILSGGPGRDGIPSLDVPDFIPVSEAKFLRATDPVVGFVWEDEAKAYPLKILVWHEIVNDVVGGRPIMMTYCPLCGTSMAFDRRIDGAETTFGVSGLLFESDVLMYDRETDSLWSQLKMEAVAGKRRGTRLQWLPSEQMTWQAWRERYPNSLVLSTAQGLGKNYRRKAYSGYENIDETYFPVTLYREDLPNKEWVVGVLVGDSAKAYPVAALKARENGPLADRLGGVNLRIHYNVEGQWARVTRADTGAVIPHVRAYWFAWQAFYPETAVFQ